jgi:hypothetical protein
MLNEIPRRWIGRAVQLLDAVYCVTEFLFEFGIQVRIVFAKYVAQVFD